MSHLNIFPWEQRIFFYSICQPIIHWKATVFQQFHQISHRSLWKFTVKFTKIKTSLAKSHNHWWKPVVKMKVRSQLVRSGDSKIVLPQKPFVIMTWTSPPPPSYSSVFDMNDLNSVSLFSKTANFLPAGTYLQELSIPQSLYEYLPPIPIPLAFTHYVSFHILLSSPPYLHDHALSSNSPLTHLPKLSPSPAGSCPGTPGWCWPASASCVSGHNWCWSKSHPWSSCCSAWTGRPCCLASEDGGKWRGRGQPQKSP